MKKLVLTIIFIVNSFILMCQVWTEPVIASTTGGINRHPDMTVDNDGIIHLVWVYKFNQNYTKIYYSRSIDYGYNWSEANALSQNDSMYMVLPKVACSDSNNIFVSYDYDLQKDVYMVRYNNGEWDSPSLVSYGLSGYNNHNRLVIDGENRVYSFWYNTSGNYYYKYLENDIWSSLICPFCDSAGVYSFADFAVDTANNLHWAGAFYYQSNPIESRLTHYF